MSPNNGTTLNDTALVLNKSWIPITITTIRKALVMLYQNTAQVVCPQTYATFDFFAWCQSSHHNGRFIQAINFKIPLPEVIRLNHYNGIPYQEPALSKHNICLRDNYTCQYCNHRLRKEEITIDHIIPRSKGGKTTWENCVVACKKCNKIKGNKMLSELKKLKLRHLPTKPNWHLPISLSKGKWKQSWNVFLSSASKKRPSTTPL
ncbi:MAG: HNH endonuclease [Planctomycetota bacterium]|nr:MAG: HNH endonuclease [Planctomycetota bacterium]